MNENHFKIVFIILVIILVLLAIYIYVFKQKETILEMSKFNSNKTDILISNNIRIGIIDFDNINPILSNNKNVQDISRLIFDSLFTLTEDYKLEGVLAKEWSKIADRTYIIKLNKNILWHDKNQFDSSDVVFTVNILKKLEESSIYYHNVKNIAQIQEIDEYTIKIITESDIPYFEYNLIFPIISSKYFKEENLKLESKNKNPVGTGLFYISDVNNESILLKKNVENSKAEELKIETITLKLYNSLSNVVDAFKAEGIDIFITSNGKAEEYLKNEKYNVVQYTNREYNYLVLNCNTKILSNKEVRQAINYAINKVDILKKEVLNNKYKISNFPLDFGSFAYDTGNKSIDYSVNKAKNVLLDNGWKYYAEGWKMKDNSSLTIELNILANKANADNVKVAKSIKEQLSAIGILIKVKVVSDKEYKKYLENGNYDMVIVNDTYSYSPSLERYFGANNLANYNNKGINTLLKEAELSNSYEEIKQKYTKIVNIYNEEVTYISLYYDTSSLVYSANLKGSVMPNSYNLFYEIETWHREYES